MASVSQSVEPLFSFGMRRGCGDGTGNGDGGGIVAKGERRLGLTEGRRATCRKRPSMRLRSYTVYGWS